MAQASDLPCDGDGVCMVCKQKPVEGEILTCKTCVTPWHVACLTTRPETLADAANWECPDCSDLSAAVSKPAVSAGGMVDKIRAIESDASLTDQEKAKRRQELLGGAPGASNASGSGGVLGILGDQFNCSICMQLLDRPVTTPCGHNFCLKCFQRWTGQQRMKSCAICRKGIPHKMTTEPRINSTIVMAIRMAKASQTDYSGGPPKIVQVMHNQDRPDKAFTTERAKKSGKANACSGKIFVTCPQDHLGPITAEYDPIRKSGVLVGETWEDRMECRQWGAHFIHVAGIQGQANHGAQSVALSGGYEDDEDHGEWFLYTGSGGRDLGGNKRTNKLQSSDQIFKSSNEALRLSCREGYPVRVVRSAKEKRSSYAPQKGVRYDGVYRIEKCWRKPGLQGFVVCRYLFIRCDNEPAPWTSDTQGDRPRPLPDISELQQATDLTVRTKAPAWDYNEEQSSWGWTRPQPPTKKGPPGAGGTTTRKIKSLTGKQSVKAKLLKEFSCLICRKVMVMPLTTPCAHNFCKACLEGVFAGKSHMKERKHGERTLRSQKNVMKCPSCTNDISDFIQNPQVNRELMNVIETLQNKMEEESSKAEETKDGVDEKTVNSSDNISENTETADMQEDADSMDEQSDSAEIKENCDAEADILKVDKNGDSMDEQSDSAENKENCDVNAEIQTTEKNGTTGDETAALRVSKRKKPCDDDTKDGDEGTEVQETVKPKRGRGRPKKVCV